VCEIGADNEIVLPNPIDISKVKLLATEPLPEAFRRWFAKPSILGSGRLVEQKRFDLLIQSFARAILGGLDANLVLLGQGPDHEALASLAVQCGVASRVVFAGFQQNPYPFMRAATAFVLSSAYEGLPTVLLEAMSLGVPVISTDCPSGPREILMDGRCGLLTAVGDRDGLASSIQRVLTQGDERQRLAREGVRRVEDFRAERVARQFEELFCRVYDHWHHGRPRFADQQGIVGMEQQ
jgi:glycosyltransferase involved in cell wall biosynthesis